MKSYDAGPEERLAEAYADAPDCPAPEVFLEASWRDLSDKERLRIEGHVQRCPACASERELARNFDVNGVTGDVSSDDVDWVVSRLEGRTGRRHRGRPVSWGLAAAAVVILGVAAGLLAIRAPGPALPDPGSTPSVKRSAGIHAVQPTGEILDFPESFTWDAVSGADKYRVRVLAVDDTIIWEKTVSYPEVTLPAPVRDSLHRAVRYRWFVEAFDADETLLARSGAVEFLVAIDADRP
jgi:hypothetical protein